MGALAFFTCSIRIEGQVIGDIECNGDITIGDTGKAHSNITARDIVIAGEVRGEITAHGKISITSKGRIYGNLTASSIAIEEGGFLEGHCKMENGAKPERQSSAQALQPSSQ